ncbi:MAG: hypothetical protein KR126chlam5_01392 [Candidatus Anoxychlamydiales bacterium]|nr:hypothetical protein [Candidatus Anoxychlamydiales bacterium]
MSVTTTSAAISLQKAHANIRIQEQRKQLLETTHPMKLTDEKVNAFVKSILTWFPVYTRYGNEVNKTLKLENVKIFADLGKKEANKDMSKFKTWLTNDIKVEIENVADSISADQYHIDHRS